MNESNEKENEQQEDAAFTIADKIATIPVVANQGIRIRVSEGRQKIGATIFGKRGTVGISLREVTNANKYSVSVAPNHKYGNGFPPFPYFIPKTELAVINIINSVLLAVYGVDNERN